MEPFPLDTPLPLLEWGTNYALATRLFCYLLLHAGVVERGGRAIVMPALPGSGKSTLTAALTLRGFRLLSDEFGVVRLEDCAAAADAPSACPEERVDRRDPTLRADRRSSVRAFPRPTREPSRTSRRCASHVDARHEVADPALVVFPRFDRFRAASNSNR